MFLGFDVLVLMFLLTQGGAEACRSAEATDGRDKAKGRRGNHSHNEHINGGCNHLYLLIAHIFYLQTLAVHTIHS